MFCVDELEEQEMLHELIIVVHVREIHLSGLMFAHFNT
jgi:hypothetical protein